MPGGQFLRHISQIPHSRNKYSSFMGFVLDIQGHLWFYCVFLTHLNCHLFTNKFLFVQAKRVMVLMF